MLVNKEDITKAKEKLGDRNADLIAELLELEQYDPVRKRSLCPWHNEDTPSFIFNSKVQSFHCFACQQNTDLIDAYMHKGNTYIEAVSQLFDEAEMKVSLGEIGVKTKTPYRYPHEEPINDKHHIYEYIALRGISKETVDAFDVREDVNGNIVFNYYDTNDVLTLVKYRPSHKIDKAKGEIKSWCQKGADTTPLLFNMNRVNIGKPLWIAEGELDAMAAFEAGCTNVVSVPLGAGNYGWIEENFDWLEQFDDIIICSDNDAAGIAMRNECVNRLGSWRTKYIEVPHTMQDKNGNTVAIKDLNHVLYYGGKEALRSLLNNVQDPGVPSVVDLTQISDVDLDEMDGITTGIKQLDSELMRLFYGTLTVVSGSPGCVDCDTEYFNGSEWKRIADFTVGEHVLQYNFDGTATMVVPSAYIKSPKKSFYHLHSENGDVDQMLTSKHTVVYKEGNRLMTNRVSDLYTIHTKNKLGFHGRFITTFKTDLFSVDIGGRFIDVSKTIATDKEIFGYHRRTYTTRDKNVADYVQLVAASAGIRAVIDKSEDGVYSVKRFDDPYATFTKGSSTIKQVDASDGFEYCFTVPSHMLVLRRNGRIFVTGNSGKTSFLSQVACNSLDCGRPVWMFSREMPGWMEKSWINYIMAGRHYVKTYQDSNGSDYYKVTPDAKSAINEEYNKQCFLYRDDASNKLEDLMISMEDSVRKYGVKLLILDNLMTIDLGGNEENTLQKQTECINKLIKFAMKYSVAIILVAHPRKMPAGTDVGMYDISGSSNIINLAHRSIGLKRIDKRNEENSHDVVATIIKDRMRGRANLHVNMYYDIPTRRFYTNEDEYNRQYKWDRGKHDALPYPHLDEEICGEI